MLMLWYFRYWTWCANPLLAVFNCCDVESICRCVLSLIAWHGIPRASLLLVSVRGNAATEILPSSKPVGSYSVTGYHHSCCIYPHLAQRPCALSHRAATAVAMLSDHHPSISVTTPSDAPTANIFSISWPEMQWISCSQQPRLSAYPNRSFVIFVSKSEGRFSLECSKYISLSLYT
jgi:hypothetical protein